MNGPPSPEDEVRAVLARLVPEIADGGVVVRAVAREPGVRTKFAVSSTRADVDALEACLGVDDARIHAVEDALGDVTVDVVVWSDDVVRFAIDAIAPTQVARVVVDDEQR